ALRLAREIFQIRSRLDLATAHPAAPSADRPPRRQRRGAGDGGQPPRADRSGLSLPHADPGNLRAVPRIRPTARMGARARAPSPPAACLGRREERAGARRSRATPGLLLAQAPELPPGIDDAARSEPTTAARGRRVTRADPLPRFRFRPDPEARPHLRR